jgi:uncharacterized protein (DUF2236 family)
MNGIILAPETSHGFFSPQAPYWRVNREWLIILAAARAAMMELAHPLVAAGVAYHSNFRQDSLGRLYRTFRMMMHVTFGNQHTARQACQRVHRCHNGVQGVLMEKGVPLPAGTHYQANDPQLKLWVLATLVDSILLVHDLFVTPLSPAEKAAYYRDSQLLGQLLGIPRQVMPATYPDFTTYVETMIAGEVLTVSDTAREVAQAIFAPRLIGPLLRSLSFAGIGLLPARLRQEFHFPWDERREQRLHRLAVICRRLRFWLPDWLCVQPEALLAEWRGRRNVMRDA